jgi:hypothetical protein
VRTFRLLTHVVEVRTVGFDVGDNLRFLGGTAGQEAVPELVRTRYELRSAASSDGTIELTEDDGHLGRARGLGAALMLLDDRLRRRVLDLAARSGWVPVRAGLAIAAGRLVLVLGEAGRAELLAHALALGAKVTAGDVVLLRAGMALGYPIPLRVPAANAASLPDSRSLGRWRTPNGELVVCEIAASIPPAQVGAVLQLAHAVDGAMDPRPASTSEVLRAVLDARIDTSVRAARADVAEASALVRGVESAHLLPVTHPSVGASLLVALGARAPR